MSDPQGLADLDDRLDRLAVGLRKVGFHAREVSERIGAMREVLGEMAVLVRRRRWLRSPEYRLRQRRATYGGMATDAITYPEQWQSTVCAGLLCSITECPSEAHDLGCTHTCHERNRA